MTTSKLVPFARARHHPDPARVEEFASTARRLQREREASAELVDRALRETPRGEWMSLATRRELQTSGVVERLSASADDLERDPRKALAVAELASALADAIDDDAYPHIVIAQIRAHAWKDRGRALCYLARYDEALGALDVALRHLEPFGTLAHDRAIVGFVRAIVLQHVRRFDEAHALLEECRGVFRDHGDVRFFTKCTLAYGNLLVRRGDYAAARDMLTPMIGGNESDAAIARSSLGWCAIHLGQPHEALRHFTEAIARFRALDWTLEVVRASYGTGSALLHLGELDRALEYLRDARARFVARGLVEEAGIAGLQIVEAHMLREDIEEAKTLAAVVASEFAAAKLNHRAVAALAYLNEAMSASNATPEVVRSVHAYICALRNDPTRDFVSVN